MMLGKFRDVVPVTMQNISGEWENASLHADHFKLYELSAKCILIMTVNANPNCQLVSPFVDSFDKLKTIHHPNNRYRLLPIKAANTAAFDAMLTISQLPGSPFHIDHRVDHKLYRCGLSYRSPVRRYAEKFFGVNSDSDEKLPIMQIHFDGIMISPLASAVIVVESHICERYIKQVRNLFDLCFSQGFVSETALTKEPWEDLYRPPQRFKFLAAENSLAPQKWENMLAVARQHDVQLLHPVGGRMQYLHASTSPS